jgi:hypothetical protein
MLLAPILAAVLGTAPTVETAESAQSVLAAAGDPGMGPGVPLSGAGEDTGEPWIKRHRPRRGELDIEVYGAGHWTSRFHRLQSDNLLDRHYRLKASPQLGLRVGIYPLAPLGFEVEGGGGPVRLQARGLFPGAKGGLANLRAHVVAQLPLWNVSPFILFGAGLTALFSPAIGLGKDVDGVVDFGAGVKFNPLKRLGFRLEYRHTVSKRCDADGANSCLTPVRGKRFRAHNPQLMFSLGVRLR